MTAVRLFLSSLAALLVLHGAAGARSPLSGPFLTVGSTQEGGGAYRIGLRKGFPGAVAQTGVGYVSGYLEVAFLHWALDDQRVYGGVAGPVAAYYFGSDSSAVRPYVGGGVAVAYVSESRVGSRDLATHLQFEDRIGLGVESGRFDAYLCLAHYSNGSLKAPNQGLNAVMLSLTWALQ